MATHSEDVASFSWLYSAFFSALDKLAGFSKPYLSSTLNSGLELNITIHKSNYRP